MVEHKMRIGDIFNLIQLNGWKKVVLTHIYMRGMITPHLNFMGLKENGELDSNYTAMIFFACDFDYNAEDGEYYEVKREERKRKKTLRNKN